MACMPRPHPQVRLFVACYPPADAAHGLLESLEEIDLPRHRHTPVEQVHLTIHFIGETPVGDLTNVSESVQRSAAGLEAFLLTPRRLVSLPEKGAARLIAVETDAPAGLLEIQRRLVRRLARNPRKRTGDRFLPHLTLCRFKAPTRMARVEHEIDCPSFRVSRIALMRSTLTPGGVEHHEVETFELRAK